MESKASGAVHQRAEAADETSTELATKLQSALGGATIGPTAQIIVQDASYASEHHAEMLADIAATKGPKKPPGHFDAGPPAVPAAGV